MRIRGSKRLLGCVLAAGALALTSLFVGCGDDETGGGVSGPEATAITVDGIVFNPKSPMPGDTMTATAVVMSGSLNVGDFVRFQWSDDIGGFLETNKTSVRWVAPDTISGTVFTLRVRASNSISSATGSEPVMVNRLTTIVESHAGEVHATASGAVYYLSSQFGPTSPSFGDFEIKLKDATGVVAVNTRFGTEYKFNRTLTQAVHVETGAGFGQDRLKQIFVDDLVTGAATALPVVPIILRRPQFTEPDFSPDGSMIAYQAFLPDGEKPPSQGGVDTFEVFVYDIDGGAASRITTNRVSFHPSFSSDGNHLVFMVDTTAAGSGEWELYSLPVLGGVVSPDTISPLTKLTATTGSLGSGFPPSIGLRAWNNDPADPVLAIIDNKDKLNLVRTDGSGSVVVSIADKVSDFAWARAGDQLAMTAGDGIYVVSVNASAQRVHTLPLGDKVSGLSWPANDEYLIYNLTRGVSSWYELIDIMGNTGLQGPIRISGATPTGNVVDFNSVMVTRPAWFSNAPTALLLFFNETSPRLATVDLSGLTP
ncbi:MAG: hypothetical protein V3V49_12105 [Candidatus Krumholzibacteria bacterium]